MNRFDFLDGLIIGLIIMGLFFMYIGMGMESDIRELGTAICLEEYQMEYDYYNSEGLHCKDNKVEQYDGLTIYIGDSE